MHKGEQWQGENGAKAESPRKIQSDIVKNIVNQAASENVKFSDVEK